MTDSSNNTGATRKVTEELTIDEFAKTPFDASKKHRLSQGHVYSSIKEKNLSKNKPKSQIKFLNDLKNYIKNTPNISDDKLLKLKARANELCRQQEKIEPSAKKGFIKRIRLLFTQKIGLFTTKLLLSEIEKSVDKKLHKPLDYETLDKLVTSFENETLSQKQLERYNEIKNTDHFGLRCKCISIFRDYIREVPVLAENEYEALAYVINNDVGHILIELEFQGATHSPTSFRPEEYFRQALVTYFNANRTQLETSIKDLLVKIDSIEQTMDKKGIKKLEGLRENLERATEDLKLHYEISRDMSKKLNKLKGDAEIKLPMIEDPDEAVRMFINGIKR